MEQVATWYRDRPDADALPVLFRHPEALCRELGDRAGLARSLANQGQVLRQLGDSRAGEQLVQQALELFTGLGMPSERDQAQSVLAGWDPE